MTRKGALTRPWGAATRYVIAAGVAKLVDARDLKSLGRRLPCGFESHPRHAVPLAALSTRGTAPLNPVGCRIATFIRVGMRFILPDWCRFIGSGISRRIGWV